MDLLVVTVAALVGLAPVGPQHLVRPKAVEWEEQSIGFLLIHDPPPEPRLEAAGRHQVPPVDFELPCPRFVSRELCRSPVLLLGFIGPEGRVEGVRNVPITTPRGPSPLDRLATLHLLKQRWPVTGDEKGGTWRIVLARVRFSRSPAPSR